MSNAVVCPSCRKLLLPGASFCAYCGTRVAEAEARREAPAKPRAVPLPDERSLLAPCAVVVTHAGAFSIPEVGRLVTKTFNRPLSDVTREMRFHKGVVAQGLTPQEALWLAREIRGLGVEAFVLGRADFVELPEAQRIRRPAFDVRGMTCEAYTWDEKRNVRVEWERLFLISAGRIRTTEVAEAPPEETPAPRRRWHWLRTHFEKHVPRLVTVVRREYVLDILLFEPWERLRLDENPAASALAGGLEDPASAIREAASGLSGVGHGAPCNAGVELLASRAPEEAWERLTFETKHEFDAYTRWVTQLVRYGFEVQR